MRTRIKDVPLIFARGYKHKNEEGVISELNNHIFIARTPDNSVRIEFLSRLEPSILPQLYPILTLDAGEAFDQYQTICDLKPLFEEYNNTDNELTLEKETPNLLHYTYGPFQFELTIVQQGGLFSLFHDTTFANGYETSSFAIISDNIQDIAKFIHCFNFSMTL